jgi:hypothetical protein
MFGGGDFSGLHNFREFINQRGVFGELLVNSGAKLASINIYWCNSWISKLCLMNNNFKCKFLGVVYVTFNLTRTRALLHEMRTQL